MDKHEQYKLLYKKYVEGKRWLERNEAKGTATEKDRLEFKERVVEPMEKIWATFTAEDREYWNTVKVVVDLFGGTIVLKRTNNKEG